MGQVVDIGHARARKHRRDSALFLRDSGVYSDDLIAAFVRTWSQTGLNHFLRIGTDELPHRQQILLQTMYPEHLSESIDAAQPWYLTVDVLFRTPEQLERLEPSSRSLQGFNGHVNEVIGFDSYLAGLFGLEAMVSPFFMDTGTLFAVLLDSEDFHLVSSGVDSRDCFVLSLLGPDAEYVIELDARALQTYHEHVRMVLEVQAQKAHPPS